MEELEKLRNECRLSISKLVVFSRDIEYELNNYINMYFYIIGSVNPIVMSEAGNIFDLYNLIQKTVKLTDVSFTTRELVKNTYRPMVKYYKLYNELISPQEHQNGLISRCQGGYEL